MNINAQKPYKGMVTDVSPLEQPKESYRYALNMVNASNEGDMLTATTEMSNEALSLFPNGFKILGTVYMNDDNICVFGVAGAYDYIGILTKYQEFNIIVKTLVLNFSVNNPIQAVYRMRRNQQRVVYFVDGLNKPRIFNFDRLYDFYSNAHKIWLDNNTTEYLGEKWEAIHFDLIKTYTKIPEFTKVEVLNEGGMIPSGSYSIAVQLVDENLNPTEWITVSHPVRIYNDSLDFPYSQIRGSRNTQNDAQWFVPSSKSIRWTLGNLDKNFSFYRVAVLQANQGDGNVNQALVSQLTSIDYETFTYSGNDTDFVPTPISDVSVEPIDIATAKFIAQMENRLILAGVKGKQINWCEFQNTASKIKSELVTQDIVVDDAKEIGNAKNPTSSFYLTGYMPDEVYSFGIVYVLKDGSKSPVFHIPGRPQEIVNTGMDYYECTDANYPDIHKCLALDYWGTDGYTGNSLVNTPIRHHKFPKRIDNLYANRQTQVFVGNKTEIRFRLSWNDNRHPSEVGFKCTYTIDGTYYFFDVTVTEDFQQGGSVVVKVTESKNVAITKIDVTGNGGIPYDFEWSDDIRYDIPLYKTITQVVSKAFGIKFTNVIKPHADVVGFEIVRNERTESDKLVVDNVILGPLVNNKTAEFNVNAYHTFGLLMPEVTAPNLSTKGMWIFSPEHQFLHKKIIFDHIDITGTYHSLYKYMPLGNENNTNGKACNGLYVEDVQAGTSFNTEYHSGEDPDGFDLQVLYRANNTTYTYHNDLSVDDPDEILYLSAAGNKIFNGQIFFNASVDNKIIIARYNNLNAGSLFQTAGGNPRLLTATLKKDNDTAYANFMNRPYYKEHNNVVKFNGSQAGNSNGVFNGDSYLAPLTLNNSTYFETSIEDREKKKKVWKIIVGAILIAAAVVVNIIPVAGQAASAALFITAASVIAISYGISMIVSGIQFETLKKMIDEHYVSGLKVCLEDADNHVGNYECYPVGNSTDDDNFRWFTDQVQNLYFESSVNIGLRAGTTAPITDFYNNTSESMMDYSSNIQASSADNFEAYLMNKYTVIDREHNSGRLYLGYATAEFYDINLDYLRKNKEKSYYTIPYEYECCSNEIETFDNRVTYSEQSYQEEKLDNYRKFLPNNYKDIEGEFGKITNIFKIANNLFIHTEEALFRLPQNLQERVTQELVTFIGTGDFFAIAPQRVGDSHGSIDRKATIETPIGIFYVSERNKSINLLGEGTKQIHNGLDTWFYNNLGSELSKYCYDNYGVPYVHYGNTVNGSGLHAIYDAKFKRILLTKIDYKPIVDFLPYVQGDMSLVDKYAYDVETGKFGFVSFEDTTKLALNQVSFDDTTIFENRSWTISFSLLTDSWVSYHSYMPRVYLGTPNFLYSHSSIIHPLDNKLYKHHRKGKFLSFYGQQYSYINEIVSVSNPLIERIWDDVSLRVTAKKYLPQHDAYVDVKNQFFNKVIFYNNYQCSGEQEITMKSGILETHAGANYMMAQVYESQTVIANNVEGSWNMNNMRNYVDDYNQPLFLSTWDAIKANYPIDKVINPAVINLNKDWMQIERFRGKYLIVRLIFTNFADRNDDVQLSLNYSLETEQPSIR